MGIGQYALPYLFHPNPQKVLIIGAGAGNDVAGALRQKVPDITAVEIDPGIQGLGDVYHPDKPYDQANVKIEIDDARSYFVRTTERFDVISFGLLDSHTATAMTNARLDHYVYTRESFERARTLLKPGGVVVMSFEPQKPYITNRMAAAIREVFGSEPLIFRVLASRFGWGGVFFVSGDSRTVASQLERQPELAAAVAEAQRQLPIKIDYSTSIVTDDWPYIYLESRRIPVIFLLANALMVLLFFRSTKHWKATGTLRKWDRRHWHFFFLGAAFMLLEIAGISRSAVVLGSTWLVNAVVISGVLVMVLLANLIVACWKKVPVKAAYVLLCISCLCLYWINLADLGTFPYGVKVLIVGLITALPMLFSGIVFIHSFASTAKKDEALGANLFGALVGALLQTLTFLTGLSSLLLIVAALYFLAWVMSRPSRSAES